MTPCAAHGTVFEKRQAIFYKCSLKNAKHWTFT